MKNFDSPTTAQQLLTVLTDTYLLLNSRSPILVNAIIKFIICAD